MSETLCPKHHLPVHLVELPDPRLTKSSNTTMAWRCEGGSRGHYISRDKL